MAHSSEGAAAPATGLIRIPVDPTGQATARRVWRKFEGEPEKMIHEISDNITTKYQDDVL